MGNHWPLLPELEEWKNGRMEPLLPELPSGKRGRPWRDNREVLEGILWVMRTEAPWRDMPKALSTLSNLPSSFSTMVFSDGSYEKVLTAITEILEKRCQLNVSECSIDAKFIASKKGALV